MSDKNKQLLAQRMAVYDRIEGPRIGDFIRLPYGLWTQITHIWDNGKVQTGTGSNYLGIDGIDYSGSYNSGVQLSDLIETKETQGGPVWFFDQGIPGSFRDKYFSVEFRVFNLREGTDLNGLPSKKEFEEKQIQDKAQTVTRLNGNGDSYTLPLPRVYLVDFINDTALELIKKNTGLEFTVYQSKGLISQPMTHEQLVTLLLTYNFTITYYNNHMFKNMLFLKTLRE